MVNSQAPPSPAAGAQQAAAYLRDNKDRFPLAELVQQLIRAGYPQEVVDEAVSEVFGAQAPSVKMGFFDSAKGLRTTLHAGGFFDFRDTRICRSFREKLVDFLFGFLGMILFGFFGMIFVFYILGPSILSTFSILVVISGGILYFIVGIVGAVYFRQRRRYFARGLFLAVLLSAILIVFAIMFVFSGLLY